MKKQKKPKKRKWRKRNRGTREIPYSVVTEAVLSKLPLSFIPFRVRRKYVRKIRFFPRFVRRYLFKLWQAKVKDYWNRGVEEEIRDLMVKQMAEDITKQYMIPSELESNYATAKTSERLIMKRYFKA